MTRTPSGPLNPEKRLSVYNCSSDLCASLERTLYLYADWERQNKSHTGGRMKKAEPSPWRLKGCLGRQMEGKHRGGCRETAASPGSRDQLFDRTHLDKWRPLADHCASFLPPRHCACPPSPSFERPTSLATLVRLFSTRSKRYGDHGVHCVF